MKIDNVNVKSALKRIDVKVKKAILLISPLPVVY
jgi:hypothetical protein